MSDSFQARINVLFVAAVASLKACRDLSEAFKVLSGFIQDVMRLAAEVLVNYTGPQKRDIVLDYVGQLYDQVKWAVPLPIWLEPFRWVFGRQVVLLLAGGLLEFIYDRHKDSINVGS